MARYRRICQQCLDAGKPEVECIFETGNKLKQHRRSRHPKTRLQLIKDRQTLKVYRSRAILALRRETM